MAWTQAGRLDLLTNYNSEFPKRKNMQISICCYRTSYQQTHQAPHGYGHSHMTNVGCGRLPRQAQVWRHGHQVISARGLPLLLLLLHLRMISSS